MTKNWRLVLCAAIFVFGYSGRGVAQEETESAATTAVVREQSAGDKFIAAGAALPPPRGASTFTPPTPRQTAGGNSARQQNPYTALTPKEKFNNGVRVAFLNPGPYIGSAFGAYFTQRGEPDRPFKSRDDNFVDGVSRFNRNFTRQATAQILGAGVYPIIFKQDPRYFRSTKRGFGRRLLYAATRSVITRGDSGRAQFNVSNVAGLLTSAALANAYERSTPDAFDAQGRVTSVNDRVGFGPTFSNFGQSLAIDAATNIVFDEFQLGSKLGRAIGKLFGR